MGFDDWLLALHLLSAFALVGALTMFSIGIVAMRGMDTPARVLALRPTMKIGEIAVGVGIVGVIVFGVWLAISLDAYQVWDLWVILAIVGWAIATELGRRAGDAMKGVWATCRGARRQGRHRLEPGARRRAALLSRPRRSTGPRPRSRS